jgi:two-component system, cell cycle response regulator DivK
MTTSILIVDDNAISLRLCRDLLQAYGYETSEATDGPEAIEMLHARRPDLVLLDIQLPNMSGLDVIRSIRSDPDLSSLPVAALTAFGLSNERDACLEAGCDAYLAKPFRLGDLLDIVENFTASGERDDGATPRRESVGS